MLPFPILNVYGNNIADRPKIVDFQGGSNRSSFYMLYDNGELYGFGDNFYGNLGQGDRINKTGHFYLISTNVRMFSGGAAGCVILKTDNSIWHCGSKLQYSTDSTNFNVVPTNISSYFSTIDLNSVKDIGTSTSSIQILLNTGELYGIGSNSTRVLGTGNTSPVTVLTKLTPMTILKMSCTQGTIAIINDTNEMYMSGSNGNAQYGDGTTTSSTSYIKIMSDVVDVHCSANITQIKRADGTFAAAGYAAGGQIGTGAVSGNISNYTTISSPSGIDIFNKIKIFSGSASFGLVGDTIYGTGAPYGAGVNSSQLVNNYTLCVGAPSTFDGISVGANGTFIYKGSELYYTGISSGNLNATGNVTSFIKITQGLPY